MLKQKYFLADIFILSAEKQPIKLSWRKIEWLRFFPRKTKDQGKDRHLSGKHRQLLEKDRQLSDQTPLCI